MDTNTGPYDAIDANHEAPIDDDHDEDCATRELVDGEPGECDCDYVPTPILEAKLDAHKTTCSVYTTDGEVPSACDCGYTDGKLPVAKSVAAVNHAPECVVWITNEAGDIFECTCGEVETPGEYKRDFSASHLVIINGSIPALMRGEPGAQGTWFKAVGRNRHERRQHARRLMDALTKPILRSNRPWKEPKIVYADELSPMEVAKYFGGSPIGMWK